MHYTHEEEESRRAEIDAAKAMRSSAEAPSKTAGPVGSLSCDALVGRLTARVVSAARRTAAEIVKSHRGGESNIDDENELVEAVEALDRHEKQSPNVSR